ncbi:hypothetical protein ABW21_db0207077 [Orbilia brochopaga]|nr:hypothetical protein ABW21_db0207077 [Drechslerella brochopaga]
MMICRLKQQLQMRAGVLLPRSHAKHLLWLFEPYSLTINLLSPEGVRLCTTSERMGVPDAFLRMLAPPIARCLCMHVCNGALDGDCWPALEQGRVCTRHDVLCRPRQQVFPLSWEVSGICNLHRCSICRMLLLLSPLGSEHCIRPSRLLAGLGTKAPDEAKRVRRQEKLETEPCMSAGPFIHVFSPVSFLCCPS